jgi:hypothetical protein
MPKNLMRKLKMQECNLLRKILLAVGLMAAINVILLKS